MASSLFGGCCGLGDMESLQEKTDSEIFSPILSLDKYVEDWAYDYFKEDFRTLYSGCAKVGKKFPKRKDVEISIIWTSVKFTHNEPVEVGAKETKSADVDSSEPPKNTSPEAGFDPRNLMEALHQETFSVKFENTTEKPCETTLSSERTVTASYEVDVHSSVQVGHNLQLSLEAGGDEAMGKVSASYEFNKMLEQYKGEKTTKEQTTKMNTECPVEVKALSVTEAKFVTTYQDFKKTFNISSEFSGRLGVDISEKKKRGKKRFYKHLSIDVCDVFSEIKAKRDSPIADRIFISGARPNWVVQYTSAATFSSSHGVDQHVRILNYPLPSHD